jgi:two-component system, OmpR family, response regulator MprA
MIETAAARPTTARTMEGRDFPASVLVVGGDLPRRDDLVFALEHDGHRVSSAEGGLRAFFRAADQPDAVVLDLPLRSLDGVAACRAIRLTSDVPLLVLSPRQSVDDRIRALDAGADVYLGKPFVVAELLACLRAVLRRTARADGRLRYADLELNPGENRVERAGFPIDLTRLEFALLELFLSRPRRVLSRSMIFEAIWGYDLASRSRALDVHIASLRRKTETGGRPRLIHTVRGVGYALRDHE